MTGGEGLPLESVFPPACPPSQKTPCYSTWGRPKRGKGGGGGERTIPPPPFSRFPGGKVRRGPPTQPGPGPPGRGRPFPRGPGGAPPGEGPPRPPARPTPASPPRLTPDHSTRESRGGPPSQGAPKGPRRPEMAPPRPTPRAPTPDAGAIRKGPAALLPTPRQGKEDRAPRVLGTAPGDMAFRKRMGPKVRALFFC